MQCNSCGSLLPPGANNCPNCGVPTRKTGDFQETVSHPSDEQLDKTIIAGPHARGPFQETPSSESDKTIFAGSHARGPFQETPSSPPASEPNKGMPTNASTPIPAASEYFGQPPSFPPDPLEAPAPAQQSSFSNQRPFSQPQQPSSPTPPQGFYPGPQPSSSPTPPQGFYANPRQPSSPAPPQAFYSTAPQAPYTATPSAFPPAQQPVPRKSGLSRGILILIAILVLLIIFGGSSLIYYSAVYHPAQLRAQATSTAETQQTRAAQATARANTQATGTAVAYVNATSTAQAIATANVVATTTALQNIYTTATSGTPALSDSLASNSSSGWAEGQATGGGGCAFSNGAYHASLDQKGFYLPCFAQNTDFSDFAFQVQMTIVQGDGGGLVFRANSGANKFYILSFGPDGAYNLAAIQDSTHSTGIASGTSFSFKQNAGQTNLIAVVARGSNMYIYVNKQYAGDVSDSTYSSGQIGVMVDARSSASNVAFQNAQIWKL